MRQVVEGAKDHFRSSLGDIQVDAQRVEESVTQASPEDRAFLQQMSSSLVQFIDPDQIETTIKKPLSAFLEQLTAKASKLKSAIDKGLAATKSTD